MNAPQPPLLTLLFALLLSLGTNVWAQEESEEAAEPEREENRVTDYIGLEPAFITNVGPAQGKISYLKATVSLRASSATTRPAVEAHMPRIRHELVMLFGEQTDLQKISGNEGRQYLSETAKERINAALEAQQTGEQVDEVLFTEFVIQR
ncbi:MAG: flagellar basal body-associated FliL family protein [Pseudomonadota bacterium]|nr:flagellar basal body-associated FliL family protein [Pseudomonadota bacterium]